MDKKPRDMSGRNGGAGGRLKQRLAQILLHSSCASTTSASTAIVSVAKTNAGAPATSSRQESALAAGTCASSHERRPKIDGSRQRRRRRGSRALVHISIDCSVAGADVTDRARRRYARSGLPSPMAAKDVVRSRNGSGSKPRSPSYRCSPSTLTDDEHEPFRSDGEEEEEAETRSTLFSSLSFSSDSTAEFYNSTRAKHRKKPPRRAPPRGATPSDAFRHGKSASSTNYNNNNGKKADMEGGTAGAPVAVVMRSHNPYADFRSSMVEMVVERPIRGADAMYELLVTYLCLNSPRHHPAIVAAFDAVFFGKEL